MKKLYLLGLMLLLLIASALPQQSSLSSINTNFWFKTRVNNAPVELPRHLGIGPTASNDYAAADGENLLPIENDPTKLDVRYITVSGPNGGNLGTGTDMDIRNGAFSYVGIKEHKIKIQIPANSDTLKWFYSLPNDCIAIQIKDASGNPIHPGYLTRTSSEPVRINPASSYRVLTYDVFVYYFLGIPGVPTLTQPSNNVVSINSNVILNWDATVLSAQPAFSSSFRIQVSRYSSFSPLPHVIDINVGTAKSYVAQSLAPGTYYWRVYHRTDCDSVVSATRTFIVANTSNFGLISPANSAILCDTIPVFSWNNIPGSGISYRLTLTAPDLTSRTYNNITSPFTLPAPALKPGLSYTWRITATDAIGNPIQSSAWSFSIAPKPDTIEKKFPLNNDTCVTLSVQLKWDAIVNQCNPQYILTYGTNPTLVGGTTLTLTDTFYNLTGLTPNTTYYWRVIGKNALGTGPNDPIWNFKTGSAPGVPTLVTPANGDSCTSLTPTFVWNIPPGTCPPLRYVFVLAKNQNLVNPIYFVDTTVSTLKPPITLEVGTCYYWIVTAYNDFGETVSQLGSFCTGRAPTCATLKTPLSGATCLTLPITFSWTKGIGCAPVSSVLQILDLSMNVILERTVTIAPQLIIAASDTNLKKGVTYRWRVIQKNPFGACTTAVRMFTMGIEPAKINLQAPANNAICQPLKPTFSWSPVSNCTPITYQIQIATNNNFAQGTIIHDVSNLSVYNYPLPINLAEGTCYFWRVRATNSIGVGTWSDVRTFCTGGKPVKVSLKSPANNSAIQSLNVILEWYPDTVSCKDVSYIVEVSQNPNMQPLISGYPKEVTNLKDTAQNLTANSCYYWRVTAKNSYGSGIPSNIWKFCVGLPPGQVTLGAPCGDDSVNNTNVKFYWNHQVQYATRYKFILYQEFNPTPLVNVTLNAANVPLPPNAQYTVSLLPQCTKFKWVVIAENDFGSTKDSCTFETKCDPKHGNLWLIDHPLPPNPTQLDTFKLTFGIDPNATDGIDQVYGEFPITQDVPKIRGWFIIPNSNPVQRTYKDFRDTSDYIVWKYRLEPKKYPMVIKWDLNNLPTEGDFTMRGFNDPNIGEVNMRTINYFNLTDPTVNELEIVYSKRICLTHTLKHGFQFISVPLVLTKMNNFRSMFTNDALHFYTWDPTATGGTGNYFSVDTSYTLRNSHAYLLFMNLPAPPYTKNITLCGKKVSDTTKIYLKPGWNLFGIFNKNIPLGKLVPSSPSLLSTGIYYKHFDDQSGQAYSPVTANFEPFYGYWIKANSNGHLSISQTAMNNDNVVQPASVLKISESWGKIIVSNLEDKTRELYIKTDDNQVEFELPPSLPSNSFDARFGDDTYAQNLETPKRLRLQGNDGIFRITAEGFDIELRDAATNGKQFKASLRSGESIVLKDGNLKELMVSKLEIPIEYNLFQNYPNPFNPTTMIKFGLPTDAKVTLKIFDMLGQEVKELLTQEMKSGYHEIEFNAANLSTGLYFYRIDAKGLNGNDFSATKKMLLIK